MPPPSRYGCFHEQGRDTKMSGSIFQYMDITTKMNSSQSNSKNATIFIPITLSQLLICCMSCQEWVGCMHFRICCNLPITIYMKFIKKVSLVPHKPQEPNLQDHVGPGPGSYDIALPLIKPNYEAIRKKNDVMILKFNHLGESSIFKSEQPRFPSQKQRSPGPAIYAQVSLDLRKSHDKDQRYSQRYSDLLEFMKRDRDHLGSTPDYTVQYEGQYQETLRKIKNSYRRSKHQSKQSQGNSSKVGSSVSTIGKSSQIVSMSKSPYSSIQYESVGHHKNRSATIDVMKEQSKMQRKESRILNRTTLYNRNMLGILMKDPPRVKDKAKRIEISIRDLEDPKEVPEEPMEPMVEPMEEESNGHDGSKQQKEGSGRNQ